MELLLKRGKPQKSMLMLYRKVLSMFKVIKVYIVIIVIKLHFTKKFESNFQKCVTDKHFPLVYEISSE